MLKNKLFLNKKKQKISKKKKKLLKIIKLNLLKKRYFFFKTKFKYFKKKLKPKIKTKKKEYIFVRKKKTRLLIPAVHGILNVSSTLNNVILTYSTLLGKPLYWFSCGRLPNIQKGERSNYFMILDTLKKFIIFLKMKKIKKIYIKFHGLGLIRKTVVRSFKGLRFKIFKLYDLTSKPHNGCKTRKYKRV